MPYTAHGAHITPSPLFLIFSIKPGSAPDPIDLLSNIIKFSDDMY